MLSDYNKIFNKEPQVRIALVLPEDGLSSLSLNLPEMTEIDLGQNSSRHEGQLTVKIQNGEISVNGIKAHKFHLIGKRLDKKNKKSPRLEPIIAGRKFHWESKISVTIPGDLEISIKDGNLFAVNILFLEDYLACVSTSEMSSKCPSALIESQTIAARSWILNGLEEKHKELGVDACNDDCCQRYQGCGHVTESSIAGAMNTAGKVLKFKDEICDARYSKSCGGILEDYKYVWEGVQPGYLSAQSDSKESDAKLIKNENDAKNWILKSHSFPFCSNESIPENDLKKYIGAVDQNGKYYRWELEYSGSELTRILNAKLDINAESVKELIILKRGLSGRISQLEIIYKKNHSSKSYLLKSELEIRQALSQSTLFSSAIIFKIQKNEYGDIEKLKLNGAGWGHGVGLCQIGALGMALKGYQTHEILEHYYPNTLLSKIY